MEVKMAEGNHPPPRSWRTPPPSLSRVEVDNARRIAEERSDAAAAAIQLAVQRQHQNLANPTPPGPQGDAAPPPGEGDAPGVNRDPVPQQGANRGLPQRRHTVSRRGDRAP
ncbi:uncharacterized protein LOC124171091 [Ischnura elegans]|uniref:uncharacterized protein LOC124171084 n=1 Tax=Ischnura elegans TaxID=197161 RepID=UPI001ED87795|nr:uncharacterized protein LOC124171084 [Ischnura elegans]XP_046406193.1 uncharacterized protein LOC124171091 [Ischnura elegans]